MIRIIQYTRVKYNEIQYNKIKQNNVARDLPGGKQILII